MQSTTLLVLRALVMLGCLVAIPLAAIFGGALPKVVGTLLDGRMPDFSQTSGPPLSEAPPFEPIAATPVPDKPVGPGVWPPPTPEVVPAGYEASSTPPPSEIPPPRPQPPADAPPTAVAGNESAAAAGFTQIEDQLRQLGASYYRLESWGNDEQLYRFHCRVALGENSSFTHYFEDTDGDPLRAMADVLEQVETWRAEHR